MNALYKTGDDMYDIRRKCRCSSTVEHGFRKAGVEGSNPSIGFMNINQKYNSLQQIIRQHLDWSMKKKIFTGALAFFIASLIVGVIVTYSRVISSDDPHSLPLRFITFIICLPVFLAIRDWPLFVTIPLIIVVVALIFLSIRMRMLWLTLIGYILFCIWWLLLVYAGTVIPLD